MTDNPSPVPIMTLEPEPIEAPEEVLDALVRMLKALDKAEAEAANTGKASVPTAAGALREAGKFYRQTEALLSRVGNRTQHMLIPEQVLICDRSRKLAPVAGAVADLFEAVLDGFPEKPSEDPS